MRQRALLLLIALVSSSCARDAGLFVEANARAHIGMLADTIGSRPAGTPANRRARDYITDQLRQLGFEVRVQETDARRHELGITARVANIIATLPGEQPQALALVTHYDSVPDAPGAADSALGVGVAIEAARVYAASARKRWTLFVLITDGEEHGLMGAAGLVTDRHVMDRLQAYINLEAIGSSGAPVLFETGPGNSWIVGPWAERAPHPRGGSYALEIYRRLPNDTDFSMLKTRGVPGLNFAAVDDSYAYHTARDTVDRLASRTIRTAGENVVSLLTAMQDVDITARTPDTATHFDIGGVAAMRYGPTAHWLLAGLALVLGVFAWVRVTGDSIRENGVLRWLLTLVWAWLGMCLAIAAMIGATWLLRVAREVYHPWYAHPGRLFILLILTGITTAWAVSRLGRWLPKRAHPIRHPVLTWSLALPAWLALTALVLWSAPAAAYLFVLPLLSAGLLMSIVPPRVDLAVRIASIVVLGVTASLWLRTTNDLLRFMVAVLGRLPIVTPSLVYGAVIGLAAILLAPPLVATIASARPLRRPRVTTAVLMLAIAFALGSAYIAPAYTREQPLRRYVRVLQDTGVAQAMWEVGSVEPGLDLGEGAPSGWAVARTSPAASVPWGRFALPFVFRTTAAPLPEAPATAAMDTKPLERGVQVAVTVTPGEPGLTIGFVLPSGLVPARSSLPGRVVAGRWTATFIAPPPEGVIWEASFGSLPDDSLKAIAVTVSSPRLPGGSGWQSLPSWLPQEAAVWSSRATWVVAPSIAPTIAPVPPLR